MCAKKLKTIHLKFYHDCPNAGDQFSLALAQYYFSANVIPCSRRPLTVPNLILVGSYLIAADAYSHVCGAGFISSEPSWSKLVSAPKSIHCVRGPLTAELLEKMGIPCPKIYSDPGILAPKLYPRKNSANNMVGIIPHFLDANLPWISSCRNRGIPIIDALCPLDRYFAEIHQCEIILSSSLHGIIFAHAYGIPALWIELSDNVIGDGFKFYDYYLSLGIPPEKVKRVRVIEDTDPYEISKLATIGDQSKLIAPLEEAIINTLNQLRRDQRYITIKNTLIPLNRHNRKWIFDTLSKYKFLKKIKYNISPIIRKLMP